MPERNNLRAASMTHVASYGPDRIEVLGNSLGRHKYISSLNYKGRYIPGEYRCNPVTMSTTVATCECGHVQPTDLNGYTYALSGDLAAFSALNMGATPMYYGDNWEWALANEATNKAYAKILSPDLEMGVNIGELRETLEGLRNPLSALRKFGKTYLSLRKRGTGQAQKIWDKRKGSDTLDALSGTWLEWRYGIRPLIGLIQDIYEHVNAQVEAFTVRMLKKGARTAVVVTKEKRSTVFSPGMHTIYAEMITETERFTSARLAYFLSRPLTWDERYGLSIYDLPSIAWELTRLSFVLDWYLSVGTWLNALKAELHPAVNILGLSLTQKTIIKRTCRIQKVTLLGQPVNFTGGGYESTTTSITRQCVAPGFNVVMPAWNSKALNLQKQIDALTLLWQFLPKR